MNATLTRPRQLTFDIGGDHPNPGGASLFITGTGHMNSELFMGDDVTIQVIDAAGEIVASYDGACVGIQFKTHEATDTTEEWVERKHIVKLGEVAG
jgi:hypothetical protein